MVSGLDGQLRREEQLDELIAVYLDQIEAGRTPHPHEWLERHAEFKAELATFFADRERLERFAAPMRAITQPTSRVDSLGQLGDFHIVREIGRGGMGVVYEAQQISLKRRVALKVLPFAAVLDPKQVTRFKNEAQAAANLDHPHIVSVYSVGCDRGIHYYAMQYVEGQSLSEVVEELRAESKEQRVGSEVSGVPCQVSESRVADTQPVAALSTLHAPTSLLPAHHPREHFRHIARLGIQAAEALHYAHEMGIVHRDIKPSNLLLECSHHAPRDEASNGPQGRDTKHHAERDVYTPKLWITDFGLATTQTDAGLTMTGDLMGTLHYMSPEQAAGDRAKIDYRTDIYSLGITLYELLTGQPAFADTERQVLLRHIIEEEPKPLRSIDSTIPRDLETIVVKATQKEPHARYDSAAELAADLKHHLRHEPIQAQRPTTIYQLQKIVRKYRGPIAAIATIFVMLILGLIMAVVGLVRINHERHVASAERDRAEQNLLLARQLIGEVVAPASDRLEFVSAARNVQQVNADLLKQAIAFYERTIQQTPGDPNARLEMARLCNRVASLAYLAGEDEQVFCHRSISILTQLVTEFPSDPTYRKALAKSHEIVAQLDWGQLRWKDSAQHYHASLKILERLVEQYPDEPKLHDELVKLHGWLAYPLQHCGEFADAEIHYRIAFQNRSISGAASLQRFADLLISQDRFVEAKFQLEEALRLAEEQPAGSDWSGTLNDFWMSIILNELGTLCVCMAEPEEAMVFFNRSLAIGDELARTVPHSAFPANVRGWTYYQSSEALAQRGQLKEAEQVIRQALQTWSSVSGRMRMHNVALAYLRLGELLHLDGRVNEATSNFGVASELLGRISQELPDEQYCQQRFINLLAHCPDQQFRDPQRAVGLARRAITDSNGPMWRYLALSQYRAGAWDQAQDSVHKSMQLRNGGDAMDWLLLAMIHWHLGEYSDARQWYAHAQEAISTGRPIFYGEIGILGFKRLLEEATAMFDGDNQ